MACEAMGGERKGNERTHGIVHPRTTARAEGSHCEGAYAVPQHSKGISRCLCFGTWNVSQSSDSAEVLRSISGFTEKLVFIFICKALYLGRSSLSQAVVDVFGISRIRLPFPFELEWPPEICGPARSRAYPYPSAYNDVLFYTPPGLGFKLHPPTLNGFMTPTFLRGFISCVPQHPARAPRYIIVPGSWRIPSF